MATCRVCGRTLAAASRGRPPRYCSRACRSKAYRVRVANRTVRPDHTEGLNVERIVRAATALADEQGAAGLSMRAVAARLGAGTMSLYNYVGGRDELIDLMVDTAFADRPLPEGDRLPDWRARLELSARTEWAIYRDHPWIPTASALITRPPIGPNVMAYTDWRMRAIDGHGLPFTTMVQAAVLLTSFVQSAALAQSHEHEAKLRGGPDRREWMESRNHAIRQSINTRVLPMIAGFDEKTYQATEPSAVFEFGLDRILDSIGLLFPVHSR